MMNSYCLFIISHERADCLLTLETLKKANYTGDYFIVVDTTDRQLDLYKKKYEGHLLIFDKEEQLKKTDTIDNFHIMKSDTYARNFIIEEVQKYGYKFFSIFDDDLSSVSLRQAKDNKLKSQEIRNFDRVVEIVMEFMTISNIRCLSFKQADGLFGGLNGVFQNGLGFEPSQAYFFKAPMEQKFAGTRSSDSVFNQKVWTNGECAFSLYSICHSSPARGSNSGGLSSDYSSINYYVVNFYNIIACPSAYIIRAKKDKFTLTRKMNNKIPKIISGRFKK